MKLTVPALVLSVLALTGCGSSNKNAASNSALSGNWEITLLRHNNTTPYLYSGFLLQSGNSVTGSLILNAGNGCAGVGPVTGTVSGQTLQLDVNQFGGDLKLSGGLPATGTDGGASMSGQFSILANGCNFFSSSTGTWTAVQVVPLSGPFHGTLSSPLNGNLAVSGTLTQGPNIGASNAQLSGTLTGSGVQFCPYLTTATITGVISGTSMTLNLYGPNGSQIGEVGEAVPATVTVDGQSLSGSYSFAALSTACPGDQGTLSVTFP